MAAAFAPTRVSLAVRLECHDPPQGQQERRLRALLTITPHRTAPHDIASSGRHLRRDAAVRLVQGLQAGCTACEWMRTAVPTVPKVRGKHWGLPHAFDYRDARFGTVCARGLFAPELKPCMPAYPPGKWDPALQATYSVSVHTALPWGRGDGKGPSGPAACGVAPAPGTKAGSAQQAREVHARRWRPPQHMHVVPLLFRSV